MKKISMILGSALMMLTVGCTTDTTKEVINNDNKVIIGLSVDETRTSLGDKTGTEYPVLWSAGDKVAVNGVASEPLAAEYAGKTAAQFAVTGVAAPFDVIYPADVLMADGKTIGISEVQEYVAGSFAQGSAVMVGHSDTPNGVIKNLYGFVKVPILKGDEKTIKSVTLHSNNLEAMSGVFAVDYVNAALEPLSGMDFVKVTAADGIPFVEDKAEVVIAVPAGTYAKGFSVKIVATDGTYLEMTAYTANGVTIAASTLLLMPDVQFYPNETVSEITDAAQLQAFLDAASAGDYTNFKNENGEVLLGSDIDMTGVTLKSATQFDGIFNGQGYALKNWKSDGVALFAANSGTVKNILIDDTCELTFPTDRGTFGFVVSSNTGIVSGCACNGTINPLTVESGLAEKYYMGAIVGITDCTNGGLVVNCINNSDIDMSFGTLNETQYVGGVVGSTKNGQSGVACMANCINNGNIKIIITTKAKNVYFGGVSGTCNTGGVIDNCTNNGNLYYEYTPGGTGAYPNIGGVTGYTAATINDSRNYGDVTWKSGSESVTRPCVGGVAGYVSGGINNSSNTGNVSVTGLFGNTSSSPIPSSAGTMPYPCLGGVAGCIGHTKKRPDCNNCENSGTLTVNAATASTGKFHIGGVGGYIGGDVIDCHNSGVVDILSTGKQSYIGGVAGFVLSSSNSITNCSNTGEMTLTEANVSSTYSYIGGILGSYSASITMSNCSNTAAVTSNTPSTIRVGGLCGAFNGTMTDCVNKGAVTMNNAICTTGKDYEVQYSSCVGGLVGYANADLQTSTNFGTVTNASDAQTSTGGLCGGVGGVRAWDGDKIDCTIISADGTNAGAFIGTYIAASGVAYTLGTDASPMIVSKATTMNGTPYTEADMTDVTKLGGYTFGGNGITITNVVLE